MNIRAQSASQLQMATDTKHLEDGDRDDEQDDGDKMTIMSFRYRWRLIPNTLFTVIISVSQTHVSLCVLSDCSGIHSHTRNQWKDCIFRPCKPDQILKKQLHNLKSES